MSSFFCAEHLARQANTSPPYSEGGVFFQIDTISPNGYNIRKSVLQSEWVVFSIIHIHSCGTNRTWKEVWTNGKNRFVIKKMKSGKLYDFRLMAVKKSGSVWTKSGWSKVNYRFFATVKQKLSPRKKAFSVKLKKVKKASGYDVIYAMNKSMSAKKTKTVKGAKRVKIKVKGLKPKKKYFVMSMPYKMYKGHKYIGILCKTKKVKTR